MRLLLSFCLTVLFTAPWSVAQEPQPPLTIPPLVPPSTPDSEQPQVPAEPQRVVGQAGSPEEAAAYEAILEETDLDVKASKGQEFLETFPDSGLTPLVHSELAEIYRQKVDVENFLKHGEAALQEVPDLANLLATMSFYYAEQRQPFKATESATKALQILGTLEQPEGLEASEWAEQKFFLSGESHYSLGRVKLEQAQRTNASGPEDPVLQEAVKHFQQCLEANPTHEFAAYRLAETYERQENLEDGLKMYARTIAINGNIAPYAQQRLDQIYEAKQGLAPKEELVAEQKQALEAAREERNLLLAQIEAESTEEPETESPAVPADPEPVPVIIPSTPPSSEPPGE